jgi:hypothetical protein
MTKETSNPSNQKTQKTRSAGVDLDKRYGAIGISAVAAALQFKEAPKKAASSPSLVPADEERFDELAA